MKTKNYIEFTKETQSALSAGYDAECSDGCGSLIKQCVSFGIMF